VLWWYTSISEVHPYCLHLQSLVPILSYMKPIHNFPLISLISILILYSHLRLGLKNGLFPSGSPTKIGYAFNINPCVLHALPIIGLITGHSFSACGRAIIQNYEYPRHMGSGGIAPCILNLITK